MRSSTFLIVVLGYLAFGISAVIWISKKKKAGEKISLLAKIIIAAVFLSSSSVLLSIIELSPTPETNAPGGSATYYVQAKSANVRECPSTSCKVIDSLAQNTPLTFPGDLFDKYPDWAEITFPNGQIGYVSKTTLSENTVPESQLTPTDDSSSVGGVIIGPWSNIKTILGDSYEFHFCEPPSAISGATCGALADTTTDPRGGTPPYSFVKKSGFLPPGMTLELNGTLRGSPTQEGTYNFRLCAKDLYGGEGCQNLAVVVNKEGTLPAKSADLDITIDSITCVLGYQDDYDRLVFSVSASGVATGPIGTYFSVWSSEPDERYTVAEPYSILTDIDPEIKTGSWTEGYRDNRTYSNKRAEEDPATTLWETHRRPVHLYNASVRNSTMVRIIVEIRDDKAVPTNKKEIFKDVACSS